MGNVPPQPVGGGKDGRIEPVQAPVAPGNTGAAGWETPSSEEVDPTKRPVAEQAVDRDGTLAEEPCTAWEEPAVDSRPQAVLGVLAGSPDDE
jgi:hypothetical protein